MLAGSCYVAASMSMVLMNKAVMSAFDFNCPNFVVWAQCLASVIFVKLAELMGFVTIEPFNWEASDCGCILLTDPLPELPAGPPQHSHLLSMRLLRPRRSCACGFT